MEIGDWVEILDDGYVCPGIHTVEKFRKALAIQSPEALDWFDNRRPAGFSTRGDETKGLKCIVVAKNNRFDNNNDHDNVYCVRRGDAGLPSTFYVNISERGIILLLPAKIETTINPYEGYTKTPDGFWTKQSNWDKWLL